MSVKKITFNNETLIDLTSDTVNKDNLLSGITAHDSNGNIIVGELNPSGYGEYNVVYTLNQDGTQNIDINDAQTPPVESVQWSQVTNKPFDTIGSNLKVVGGALSVDTTDSISQDNTKPITSGAVYAEIGNISALLATI